MSEVFDVAESARLDQQVDRQQDKSAGNGQGGAPQQAEKPKKEQFNIIDVVDFMAMEIKPQELLLDPWLPSPGLVMVYAWRGVGKTYFALNVAYAVATGGTFLKWQAKEPKRVLYLDGEMPAIVMQNRLAAIIDSNEKKVDPGQLQMLSLDFQDFSLGMLDLSLTEDQAALEPYLKGFDLIIVDNLSTLCRTGRENEGESWGLVQQWGLSQRKQGRTVLFVHHAGKDGEQRGTSKREDTVDMTISLKRPRGYKIETGAQFEINYEKPRLVWGEPAKPIVATLTTDGRTGKQTWKYEDVETSTRERIKELLEEYPGIQQKRLQSS